MESRIAAQEIESIAEPEQARAHSQNSSTVLEAQVLPPRLVLVDSSAAGTVAAVAASCVAVAAACIEAESSAVSATVHIQEQVQTHSAACAAPFLHTVAERDSLVPFPVATASLR